MSKQSKYPPILCQLFRDGTRKALLSSWPKNCCSIHRMSSHFLCTYIIPMYLLNRYMGIKFVHLMISDEKPSNKVLREAVDPKVGCSHREYLPISPAITLHGSTLMPYHKIVSLLPRNTLKELLTQQSWMDKSLHWVCSRREVDR